MKLLDFYDVVIVGGGGAGISAGLSCLKDGHNVLLITGKKKSSQKSKSIESIHPGVLSLLDYLQLDSIPSDCILGEYNFISDGENSKSLNPYTSEIWTGYHIQKNKFNEYLLNQAKSKKISILDSENVTDVIHKDENIVSVITSSGKRINSKYFIDASGTSRILSRKLNFQREYFSKTYIVLSGICSDVKSGPLIPSTSYFVKKRNGWTWFAQLYDNSFYWTRLLLKTEKNIQILKELSDFIDPTIIKTANMRWRINRPVGQGNVLLSGDAACIIDPAGGNGILNSIRHGMMAANVINSCLAKPENEKNFLNLYDKWLFDEFQNKVHQLKAVYNEIGIEAV